MGARPTVVSLVESGDKHMSTPAKNSGNRTNANTVNEKSDDRLRAREDWLRQELRACRTLMTTLLQWGTTVMVAVELNLYYIRRGVIQHLLDTGTMHKGDVLPFLRWGLGTGLLCILALVFSSYIGRIAKHHRAYRAQLQEEPSYSGIDEKSIPIGGRISWLHHHLFWAFPIFDGCAWLLFFGILHVDI